MKKIYNIFTLIVIVLTGLSLTACSEDNLDTNQYHGGVTLNAYGPNPVTRGGTLRFVGSNLNQIASIYIPGVGNITNFDVKKSGIPSEIWVTVPKEGPEVGKVILTTQSNDTIVTGQDITYTEGVEFDSITPSSVMPGDTITIEGEYLYLINMVEFAENVRVSKDDFISQERHSLKVVVPDDACTGKVNLYTVDLTKVTDESSVNYEVFQSEDALEIGTPAITKLVSPRGEAEAQGTITAKQGETITITGNNLNLITSIITGDEDSELGEYEFTNFNVSSDGKTITFTLPAKATDGDIKLVCKSGIEVPVGKLVTVAPSECSVSPNPVKAGNELTITGKDMDVVTGVIFPNVDATYTDITVTGTSVKIKAVPQTAQDGNIKLVMANGKTVSVAYTLVKPEVKSYSSSPVNAGGALVLTGTNLDLVSSVTFGDATTEGKVSDDGTTYALTVPMAATSGKPVLNLANGTTVACPELSIEEAVFCYITTLPDEDNKPEVGTATTLPVKNGDKLTNVYVNNTEVSFVYDSKNSQITFAIPEKATSTSTIKLVSSNGSISYTIAVNTGVVEVTTIWTGSWENANWGGNQDLAWGGYDWSTVKAGTTAKFYYTKITDAWGCISLRHGNGWGALPSPISGQYDFVDGATYVEAALPQNVLDDLVANGGLVITGANFTLTKVTLE